jgi:hypothetical protein
VKPIGSLARLEHLDAGRELQRHLAAGDVDRAEAARRQAGLRTTSLSGRGADRVGPGFSS